MTTAKLGPSARAAIEGRIPDHRRPDLTPEQENERLRVLLMAARQASQRRLRRASQASAGIEALGPQLRRQGQYIEAQKLALEDAEIALGLLDLNVELARTVLADGLDQLDSFRVAMRKRSTGESCLPEA